MKAIDVLQRYRDGRRDFRGENLQGQSFQNQNLSGADFSEADLRGTNFSGATLHGSRFCKIHAGLQIFPKITLVFCFALLSGISGFFFGFVGYLISLACPILTRACSISGAGDLSLGDFSSSLFALILLSVFLSTTLSRGLNIGLFIFIITAIPIAAIAVIVAFTLEDWNTLYFTGGVADTIIGTVIFAIAITSSKTIANSIGSTVSITFNSLGIIIAFFISPLIIDSVGFTINGVLDNLIVMFFCFIFQFFSIHIGTRAINGDPKYTFIRQVFITLTTLRGTSFKDADLTKADFNGANLKSTNFCFSTLTRTCWKQAKYLEIACTKETILEQPAVRELLVTGNGYGKFYEGANLRGANLAGANLERASLKHADLSHAILSQANLKDANLSETLAVGADFSSAYLTGTCLEAWTIDSTTELAGVDCQFVFLREHPNTKGNRERRPHDPNRVFEPGDFEKLYTKMMNIVQILLRDGMNPEAFQHAWQNLVTDCPDATMQAIERKGNDVLVTLEVPENADKGEIERHFLDAYEARLQAARTSGELEAEKRHHQDMKDLALAALGGDRFPIFNLNQHSQNQAMNEHTANTNQNTKNVEVEMTFEQEVIGAAGKVMGNQIANPKQSLANSAVEIQQLIQILNQSYPPDLPADTQAEIDVAVKGIKKDPALKQRVVSALREGGVKALTELTDNPYVSILLAAYDGWRKPK